MKTNTITTIKLEAEEGYLILNKSDRLIHGKVFFCPLSRISDFEELPEPEALELIKIAEEEKARQEAEELARQEQEEKEASEHGDNSSTNN